MMAVSTENFEYSFLKTVEVEQNLNQCQEKSTLESGINIALRLLFFDFFPGTTALFRTP